MTARRWRRGANSSSSESGATIAVRPDGNRKISLPSEVIPTTRLRTEPTRLCGQSSENFLPPCAGLDPEATAFFLPFGLGWLHAIGCPASSGFEDALLAEEEELSAIAPGELCWEAVGPAACD